VSNPGHTTAQTAGDPLKGQRLPPPARKTTIRDGAWPHFHYWIPEYYERYREYVRAAAPSLRNRTEDCADLSMLLIIDFAAANGLPLTFTGGNGIRYMSLMRWQDPPTGQRDVLTWKDKDGFRKAVLRRLNAALLFDLNTEVNPAGPQPGDVMLSENHAAIVFDTHAAGKLHPYFARGIPTFPGPEQAAKELTQTEYFRGDPKVPGGNVHLDYVNHRGTGQPVKQQAELIYNADSVEMKKEFQFRKFSGSVLDNWIDWNGIGKPPR
jgi:hypothetical protein